MKLFLSINNISKFFTKPISTGSSFNLLLDTFNILRQEKFWIFIGINWIKLFYN